MHINKHQRQEITGCGARTYVRYGTHVLDTHVTEHVCQTAYLYRTRTNHQELLVKQNNPTPDERLNQTCKDKIKAKRIPGIHSTTKCIPWVLFTTST